MQSKKQYIVLVSGCCILIYISFALVVCSKLSQISSANQGLTAYARTAAGVDAVEVERQSAKIEATTNDLRLATVIFSVFGAFSLDAFLIFGLSNGLILRMPNKEPKSSGP